MKNADKLPLTYLAEATTARSFLYSESKKDPRLIAEGKTFLPWFKITVIPLKARTMTTQRYQRRRLLILLLFVISAFVAVSYFKAPPKIVKTWSQLIQNRLSKKSATSTVTLPAPEPLSLLAAVYSAPGDHEMRNAVRETWGQYLNMASKSRLIFFMDKSSKDDQLTKEAESFKDIVRLDFIDSFSNQSARSIYLFQWIVDNRLNVKYLLRADQRSFVNIPKLVDLLKGISATRYMLGHMTENPKPERNKGSPWYISKEDFPGDSFPAYLQSYGYLMTGNLIPELLEKDKHYTRVWIEDVYITGILTKRIGATLIKSDHIVHSKPSNNCDYRKVIVCFCTSTYEAMKDFYKNVEMPSEECGI